MRTRIIIFSHITKFYTMIDKQDGTFDCNYGPTVGWTKTVNKDIIDWDETYNDRETHEYTLVCDDYIELDNYYSAIAKMEILYSMEGAQDSDNVERLRKSLLKWGKLSKAEMKEINSIYKKLKGKQ